MGRPRRRPHILQFCAEDALNDALQRAVAYTGDDMSQVIRTNLRVGLMVNGWMPQPSFASQPQMNGQPQPNGTQHVVR
jgi:hypothetical protein